MEQKVVKNSERAEDVISDQENDANAKCTTHHRYRPEKG